MTTRLRGAAGLAFLCLAAPAPAQYATPLRADAAFLQPAPYVLEPDSDTLQIGKVRTVKKGETMFAMRVRAPQPARLRAAHSVAVAGQAFALDPTTLLDRYSPGARGGSALDKVRFFCSPRKSALSDQASLIVKPEGGKKARLCFVDAEADGTLDKAFVDGVFYKGVKGDQTRKPVDVAIAYELAPPGPKALEGRLEFTFGSIPWLADEVLINFRYRGEGDAGDLTAALVDSGYGYFHYPWKTILTRYNPTSPSEARLMGVRIGIGRVVRADEPAIPTMQFRVESAVPSYLMPVFVDTEIVPIYRLFAGSELPPGQTMPKRKKR